MGRQTPRSVTFPPAKEAELYRLRAEAAELRRGGMSWHEIAERQGCDKQTAFRRVQALLKEHQSLAYNEIALYRQESLDRLTQLLAAAMPRALKGDEKMMREARLIIGQIGDLTGEKAPVKVQIGESDVDRLLRDALEEFRRRTELADREARAGSAGSAQDG